MSLRQYEPYRFEETNAAIAATDTWVSGGIVLDGRYSQLCIQVANGGAVNLADFQMHVKVHPDGTWHLWYAVTDWIDATILSVRRASNAKDLGTLAAGTDEAVWIDLPPVYAIRFNAKAASSTTTVTILGSARR